MLHLRRIIALMFVFAFAIGCSGQRKTTTLTGIITYQGAPVTVGMIFFLTPDDHMANGPIRDDGHYTATDVPVGELRVFLMVKDPGLVPPTKQGSTAGANSKSARKGVTSVPAKFADPNTSGLKFTITANTTTLDVKID